MHVLCLRQPHPADNFPLLRIGYPRRVQPVGQLIGGACGVVPHEGCGEVLRNPCALTLGDEPLAGAVEHGAVQLWVTSSQPGIPLHNLVDSEIREQPASPRQDGIQQVLQHPMQWHLPLCSLGLQQAYRIGPDADKPP